LASLGKVNVQRSGATVAMGFVTGLTSGWKARGIDPSVLLAGSVVSASDLANPTARIPLTAYAALYNNIVDRFDDEALGLFAQPMRCGSFEFLTRGVIGSDRLEEALNRASRFLAIVLPQMKLVVLRGDNHARLEIRETVDCWPKRDDPRRIFAFEWLLRLIHSLSCWLADTSIALETVDFPFAPPAHSSDYASIYTAHSNFGGEVLSVVIPASVLELQVRRNENDLESFLDGAPGRISMLYRRDRETFRRVRDVIITDLATTQSIEQLAARLHMSKRTLQRRLREEGLSVRCIREDIRRQLAFAKLTRTDEPIEKIAIELGYSDMTVFYRAFRGWTSQGPREYRNSVCEEPTLSDQPHVSRRMDGAARRASR